MIILLNKLANAIYYCYCSFFQKERILWDFDLINSLSCGKKVFLAHCASAGELQAAYPVLYGIKEGIKDAFIITAVETQTGVSMAKNMLGSISDFLIYFPIDTPKVVRSFVYGINFDFYLNFESPPWPNFMPVLAQKEGVLKLAINYRIPTKRSLESKILGENFWEEPLKFFDKIFVVSGKDKNFFVKSKNVNEKKIIVAGSTKIDAILLRKKNTNPSLIRKRLNLGEKDLCVIAGSVRRDEIEICLKAFLILKSKTDIKNIKLILVPRHDYVADKVYRLSNSFGFKTAFYSNLKEQKLWEVLVVDVMGVLFELYSVSVSAFVGGSIVKAGGQNILEPFVWGIPLCYGKYIYDFAKYDKDFRKLGVSKIVESPVDIADFWYNSIVDNDYRLKVKEASWDYFSNMGGASSLVLKEII